MTTLNVLVDSSAWLNYFAGGQSAEKCRAYVNKLDKSRLLTNAIIVYEVFKKAKMSLGETRADRFVSQLLDRTSFMPFDSGLAIYAANISLKRGLSMADALIYAAAKLNGAMLVTSDRDFKGLEGVEML
ncbi:MAG: type II toxin-antitoxin system VapC family toxin [Candidatus Diapherotrites archaeon]|uniref:Ribonuclease VapC n=1 Tax=Candidatus Iainarchaeum sp. TaxID=3101447 RepID=A0A8T3YNQ7_9ARCH|nr:type II toxin-antitoxin system VapC family toxin [Candidatus Diapherotrites archaeon]